MRRLTLLSGSKLKLASHCTWWANPDVPQVDVGSVDARAVGTAFHKLAESRIRNESEMPESFGAGGDGPIPIDVLALYSSWIEYYGEYLDEDWKAEVTYAFDVDTRKVRILGYSLDRKYVEAGLLPTEIPVTVDAVHASCGCVFVYDWKTGRQFDREPIGDHKQLRAGGFCAARVAGVDEVTILASYVDDDGVKEEDCVLSEFDFAMIEEELVDLHDRATGRPQPNPGTHCADLWCPAITSCPAVHRAQEDVLDDIVTTNAAAIRSPDQAAEAYVKLRQVDAMSAACWKALDAYVDANGPVILPDGKFYSRVEKSRDSIRLSDEAIALVRSKLGTHADKAIKTTLTKDAIADATKAAVGGGKARVALEKDVMAGLESLGAVHVTSFVTHEPVKAKKGEAA